MSQQHVGIRRFEIVVRILNLVLMEDITIGHLPVTFLAIEVELITIVDALHIHGEALQTIGQFAGDDVAFNAADLLKIGELRDFHAIAPDFPTEAPGTQCRAFPIILDKANIMVLRVDAQLIKALEI